MATSMSALTHASSRVANMKPRSILILSALSGILGSFAFSVVDAYAQAVLTGGGCNANAACTVLSLVSNGTIASSGVLTVTRATGNAITIATTTAADSLASSGGAQFTGNLQGAQFITTGISLRGGLNNDTNNNFGAINITDTKGLVINSAALPTCGDGSTSATVPPNTIVPDVTGGTGGVLTKVCLCTYDGTSTYEWRNLLDPTDTAGDTTTCPAL